MGPSVFRLSNSGQAMLNTNRFFCPTPFLLVDGCLMTSKFDDQLLTAYWAMFMERVVLASEYRGFVQYPSLGLNKTKKYFPKRGLVNEQSIQ